MNATIQPNLIPVMPSTRSGGPMDGVKFLTIEIPNGWDDVKKICKKVLQYEGVNYTFTGWNSDSMKCYFRETANVAKIKG